MKIRYVKSEKIEGFWGMNPLAAKHFKIKGYPKDVIMINKNLSKVKRKEVERHERVEYFLMKNKKFSYKKADKIAEKFEKRSVD